MKNENFMGCDVPFSGNFVLDRYRLEARIRVLGERKESHGLSEKGAEILSYCEMHLQDIKDIYYRD